MMRTALLSAGPSLVKSYDASQPYDLVVGVNTAAALYDCDWWSVADAHRFYEITPKNNPSVFTIGPERDKILASDQAARLKSTNVTDWNTVKESVGLIGTKVPMPNWSCTSALMLCKYLGATSVDVYGVDLSGERDVTGEKTHHRNADRWKKELVEWDWLVEWMREAGVEVERVTA